MPQTHRPGWAAVPDPRLSSEGASVTVQPALSSGSPHTGWTLGQPGARPVLAGVAARHPLRARE